MDYIKAIIAGVVGGVLVLIVGAIAPKDNLGAYDRTTAENPWTFLDDVTISGSGSDLTVGGDLSVGDDVSLTGDAITTNGSTRTTLRETLRTSTTTVCALQAPAATTTLESFAVRFTVGSTTAKSIIFTTGTAMQSTTTALSGSLALAANAQGSFQASTTNPEATRVLSPSAWLQVSMVGGQGVDSPTGACSAVLRSI